MMRTLRNRFLLVTLGILFGTVMEAKAICPQNFTGGMFIDCQYNANDTCSYTCISPFRRNTHILNVTCGSDGGWNQNTQKLCTSTCAVNIPNGYLNSSCTSTIRETCTFDCYLGYKEASLTRYVTCNESAEWVPQEPCTEILCPTTIINGTVNAMVCSRRVYSECPFTCNQGFDPNPKSTKLFCGSYGNWMETVTPSCSERQGLCINFIDNGRWATGCQFRAKESCEFECDSGFQKHPNITGNITCTVSGIWNVDPKLLCKSYDRGLIITLNQYTSYNGVYIQTVPITTDGAPTLDSTRKLSFWGNLWLLSVDGDYALRQAYFYEYYTTAIYRDSSVSVGVSGENTWTPIHRGVSKGFVKLAVDWISHNIYWTDPQYKWIVVQSLLGNDTSMYRVLIHDNLQAPHALALDPMEALLFWSDIGGFTKIEVSSLSGENRKCLISTNLVKPLSMAADYGTRRIYWVDPSRYTLESITYEGKERQILLRNNDVSFFDLAVFKDYLYVTDSVFQNVHFLNKTNGEMLKQSLSGIQETYIALTVFHPEAQPTSVTAFCVNYGCEHICVTEKDGASCLCRDGYTLNPDLKNCSVNNEYFHRGLVFSNDSSICIVDIRVLTDFSYDPKCVLNINGTRYMVIDTDDRQIIIANGTSIYWTMVDNLALHVLTKPFGYISGLAWDGYDRNVYWSERDTGIIWRLSRESDTAIVFLSGLINPRNVLIVPHERLLYWISDRNVTTIEYSSLDGSNHQIMLYNDFVEEITYIAYDMYTKRIYILVITVDGWNYVFSCKLDGSDLTYSYGTHKRLATVELYKGHMLLASNVINGTLLMSFYSDLTQYTISGVFPGVGNISSIKFFDENFRQNETGPCYNINGGCEHICVSSGNSKICECTFGFKLAPNGMNCLTDPIKDDFMLIKDGTHNSIYQISLTDQTIRGIISKLTEYITDVIYSPVDDLIIWGTDDTEISMIHLNGTGHRIFLISDEIKYYPHRFAVDISTGNIYYTAVHYMEYMKTPQSYIGVMLPNGKLKTIITGLRNPQGVALYQSKGLMFYIDIGNETYIGKANMDGTQASVLMDFPEYQLPSELTIDYKDDYLYWFDYAGRRICYCKLDGTNYQTLVKYPDINLNGFALYQDFLYITAENHVSMKKVKISNPNEATPFANYAELGSIRSISIYSSRIQSKNAFCSVGNGGCSTFCFPTPHGGICACEDGVNLKDGSDTLCSNTVQCPLMMGNILVSNDCQRVNGSTCNFTCLQGYRPRQDVKNVLCNGMTYSPADSCEAVQCPLMMGNILVSNDCQRVNGSTCKFTCLQGYRPRQDVKNVLCNGMTYSPADSCEAVQCPLMMGNILVSNDCQRVNGSTCKFTCLQGYRPRQDVKNVLCNGMTYSPADSCEAVQCPLMMGNILVSNDCQRVNGSTCKFTCLQGYRPRQDVKNVLCNGMTYSPADSCEAVQCPLMMGNILVSNDCQRVNGSTCKFTCLQGYRPRQDVKNVLCNGMTYSPADSCEESPTILLANKSEINRAAVGAGVGIGVAIIIVIIVVSIFFMMRRRNHNLAFAPKRMQEEVMNATFGPEPGNEFAEVSFENGAVNIMTNRRTPEINTA